MVKDKLAPRLGFAYNLLGDDRVEAFRLLRPVLRLDEVRVGARHVRWRHLDHAIPHARRSGPDEAEPIGTDRTELWDRRRPTPSRTAESRASGTDVVDPNMKPMSQDPTTSAFEYQARQATRCSASTSFATNLVRTIEDIGTLVNGSEAYIYGNPGEGLAETAITTGRTASVRAARRPSGTTRRSSSSRIAASAITGSSAAATSSAASTATTRAS